MHVNNDFQRNCNISQVFKIVWQEDGISRIDISKKLDIYRSTVSNIIDFLIEHNLIKEGERGTVTKKGGRKPISLLVNPDAGIIIGIEMQIDFYNINVLDLSGNSIFKKKDKLVFKVSNSFEQNEKNFEQILDKIIQDILIEKELQSKKILGICLGIPGIVDTKEGKIIKSIPFGLQEYNFSEELFMKYGFPLLIENDAKCCAALKSGTKTFLKNDDFICVLIREHEFLEIGIGLSVVINGKILDGHNFAAGEYKSISWRKGKKGQTGLPEAVIRTVTKVDDSYKEWIKDLFSTLTVFVPLLEPKKIFIYGLKENKIDFVKHIINEDISQFIQVVEECKSECIFEKENDFETSKGAALMFIQKLFNIPYEKEYYFESQIRWDKII